MRKEFERCTPESVGIPSASIEKLLDALEEGWTEPHGLMIMRDSKVCAEGWWAPYAPGLIHGLQSHTKTYAATAVGIAVTEGILKLTDRVIDIFPDKAPKDPSENLKLLTVRDVLCMGCGMEKMPFNGVDWIEQFLATPVVHKPGTAFMYNSTGSTLLGAMVREKTGLGLIDYLKPRLFDKIGIDAANLKCICMDDGMEMGGGGLYATTEDNLRLMKLYADGGVWEGERILAEDYVRLATTNQNDSATESINNPEAFDNFLGYGFQIWMCKPQHVYRADGAMGQFTIVCPDQDMEIAITETAVGAHWAQSTLDITWKFLEKVTAEAKLAADEENYDRLCRKLQRLNIGNPACQPFSPSIEKISGKTYKVKSGDLTPFGGNFMSGAKADGIDTFSMNFDVYGFVWDFVTRSGRKEQVRFATNGTRFTNLLGNTEDLTQIYLGDAYWQDEETLVVHGRWVETCIEDTYLFKVKGDELSVVPDNNSAFKFFKPEPIVIEKL